MQDNWLKTELAAGRPVTGLMVGILRTPSLGHILDAVGMDFAIIDQEHGAYGPGLTADLLAGFRGGRCLPIVRVPAIRQEYFAASLDFGAAGVMVPNVSTEEEAEACVTFSRYAPLGTRGVCSLRPHSGFSSLDREAANANTLLAIQIESAEAIENLDSILAVPGIDVAFIGCADLSASLGVPNSLDDPTLATAVKQVFTACRTHGVVAGMHTYNPKQASELIKQGLAFISCQTDIRGLIEGLKQKLDAFRDCYEQA